MPDFFLKELEKKKLLTVTVGIFVGNVIIKLHSKEENLGAVCIT